MIVPTEALPLLDVIAKFSPHSLCNLRRGGRKGAVHGNDGRMQRKTAALPHVRFGRAKINRGHIMFP